MNFTLEQVQQLIDKLVQKSLIATIDLVDGRQNMQSAVMLASTICLAALNMVAQAKGEPFLADAEAKKHIIRFAEMVKTHEEKVWTFKYPEHL